MLSLDALVQWIEGHSTTVDLLKWFVLLLVTWMVGGFRYVGNLTRGPRLSISSAVSRCLLVHEAYEDHPDATKSAFLLNLEVANRSAEKIVVGSFVIRFRRQLQFRRWSEPISAVSLPNRVRHEMGSGTKVMRNWFSYFPDGQESLTVDGKIEPRDAASGFALFVGNTYGSWNPRTRNDQVTVKVIASLTSGRRVSGKAKVSVTRDREYFEKMVPGINDQIDHPSAWNVPSRF